MKHHPECGLESDHGGDCCAVLSLVERDNLASRLEAESKKAAIAEKRAEITEEYATSRLCVGHRGHWSRERCVLCDLERAQSRLEACEKALRAYLDAGTWDAIHDAHNGARSILTAGSCCARYVSGMTILHQCTLPKDHDSWHLDGKFSWPNDSVVEKGAHNG